MEMTFYDDNLNRAGKINKPVKRPSTLDLDLESPGSKKNRFTLTSPDLKLLKLASPDLERFIIANCNLATTPTPTQYLFPKNVTEEQEQYARGFIDALNQLHQTSVELNTSNAEANFNLSTVPVSTSPAKLYSGIVPFYLQPIQQSTTTSVIKSSGSAKNIPVSVSSNVVRPPSIEDSSSCNSNSFSTPLEISVKEESSTVPSDMSTPPLSPIYNAPIDMADQERIKLERKRQRNRIAASKCRKRKLEKIAQLEDKVKELKGENSKLEMVADKLREQVCSLKETVLQHVKKGCQIMIAHSS